MKEKVLKIFFPPEKALPQGGSQREPPPPPQSKCFLALQRTNNDQVSEFLAEF